MRSRSRLGAGRALTPAVMAALLLSGAVGRAQEPPPPKFTFEKPTEVNPEKVP